MSIQYQEIQANNLVPIFATEFDNSLASKSGPMPWKNIIIGQAKDGAPTALTKINTAEEAASIYGSGSQVHLMVKAFRKSAKYMDLYVIGLQDPASNASAAVAKLNVTGTASESAPLCLTIDGQAVNVTVIADDDAAAIKDSIAAKINALPDLPVTAEVPASGDDTGKVVITAKNKGAAGNDIGIFLNFNQGETTPAGVTIAEFASTDRIYLAGGTGDTEFGNENVGSLIAGTWFNAIAISKGDNATTGNVNYIKELLDERWTAMVQQPGVLFYAVKGNKTTQVTAGNARNSQVICIPGLPDSPSQPCEIAAAAMGQIAVVALNDPAVPLANWPVAGVVAPKLSDRLDFNSKNDILRAGVALLDAGEDGSVYLKRTVTTYKRNSANVADTSYQQLEKIFTLSFLRWDWNSYMAGKYPHAKLADDGNEYGPGQVVMTPKLGKAEILTRYKYWMSKGLVQNYEEFKANVVVERDPDDSTALNFLIPADLIDQLLICKSKIQFK